MNSSESRQVYADHNATTPPLPEVVEAVTEALNTAYGNASSAHRGGEPARRLLQKARTILCSAFKTPSDHFIFTGSGTEANNLALKSLRKNAKCLITTAIEHSSVLKTAHRLQCDGLQVEVIPVDADGVIDLDALQQHLVTNPKSAISVQWVNNETGVVQPVDEIAELAKENGALLHLDAAQAAGKTERNFEELRADLITLSAHKFNGPAGVGALHTTTQALVDPICIGGAQQLGLHAGTENIAGIAGLSKAIEIRYARLPESIAHMKTLRDVFESTVLDLCSWVRINGKPNQRICNTTNLLFEGIDGQALVGRLDAGGIYCSQSSACTNARPEPSYVLRAMGLTEAQAYASVRFSFGVTSTLEEVTYAAHMVAAEALYLKRFFA